MPNALTNTNISATYKGVLHADGESIPSAGLKPVYDGTGFQSALSVGRSNQGATVSGLLSANDLYAGQLRMPNTDGAEKQVVARSSVAGILELRDLSELIGGSAIPAGVYDNPRITVGTGGVITKIESRPTIVILDNPVSIIPDYGGGLGTDVNGIGENSSTVESFNINWAVQSGFYADAPATTTIPAKYAIITVELFIHSGSREFETQMRQDSKIIAKARVDSNDTKEVARLDNNRYVYRNQQIVKIPTNSVSLFEFHIYMTEIEIAGRYNRAGRSVTLDGWVF
jgi:hypothetical protein